MPSTGTGTVHHRRAPAPRQKHFPMARRSTRNRRPPPPPLLQQQSTLTQLDFVGPSLSPYEEAHNDYSVPTDDEDELAAPRPKKKQRKNGKEARTASEDQSTMTQHWRNPTFAKSGASSDDVVLVVDDSEEEGARYGGDDMHIQNDDDDQGQLATTAKLETQRQALLLSDMVGLNSDAEDVDSSNPPVHPRKASIDVHHSGYVTGSPRKSNPIKRSPFQDDEDSESSPQPKGTQRLALISSFGYDENSTRPTTANSAIDPKTPQKHWRSEVPSSETPSSLKLSAHDTSRNEVYQRSPLKERSCNISALKQSLNILQEDPDGLQATENTASIPIKDLTAKDASANWTAKLTFTPKKEVKHSVHALTRTTTIQDSEEGSVELSSPRISSRTLKRTAVVQDSQMESALPDMTNEQDDEDYDPNAEYDDFDEEEQQQYTYMQQNTFDPVSAALDRDAARFGKTATQLQTQTKHYFLDQDDEEESGSEGGQVEEYRPVQTKEINSQDAEIVESSQPDDRPRGPPLELGESPAKVGEPLYIEQDLHEVTEAEVIESSQPGERGIVYSSQNAEKLPEAPRLPFEESSNSKPADLPTLPSLTTGAMNRSHMPAPPTQRTQSRTQTQSRGNIPDPSQISTIVPSQPSRPNSAHGLPPTSPRKSGPQRLPETLSSSPFSLPPWTINDAFPMRNQETQGTLSDFSLPPPSLMLSSSSQAASDDGL